MKDGIGNWMRFWAVTILSTVLMTSGAYAGTTPVMSQVEATPLDAKLLSTSPTLTPATPETEQLGQKFADFTARVAGLRLQRPLTSLTPRLLTTLTIPTAKSENVTIDNPGFLGFDGVSAEDSGAVNGFLLEPPDQGVCVGGGYVIELNNLALKIFHTNGTLVSGPTALSTIFLVSTSDFLSDPRCIYDAAKQVFYFSILDFNSTNTASALLVDSISSTSLSGVRYVIDTTDNGSDGTPSHPGCPCFIDQPYLGLDSHGIFIAGTEFSITGLNDNGAQIYALRREDVAAMGSAGLALFQNPIGLAEGTAQQLSPAWSPPGQFETRNGGTEYLLGSLDFTGTLDNRLGLFAVLNTCGIPSTTTTKCSAMPTLTAAAVLHAGTYGLPPLAKEPGENGTSILDLNTDDDRMQQTVFSHGDLYSALTTKLMVEDDTRAGIEYFMIHPSVASGKVHGSVKSTYVGSELADVFYPSITANAAGKVLMAFDLSSEFIAPSMGYLPLTGFSGTQELHIAGIGFEPYTTSAQRWGDYSAATIDESGNFWFAGEYVPPPAEQTYTADWGTYIGMIPTP